ncbi:hypothetical protein [Streptomyces tateyamensis]|uniref:hypothetical protein n=1 Tax=Streptomyces tateyamensis TaxID=565073 RepID=UPI0015E8B30A|nr:hypothetical protein [Streptomyces tateyamensis]
MKLLAITLIVHAPDPVTGVPLHAEAGGLTDAQHRDSLELFQSDIAPTLRREIPDPPWAWGPVVATATTATR